MCHNLTILAHDDAGHTIAQCEHGTIHVCWECAAIFLHPDDLLPLLALLQCWQPNYDLTKSDEFTIARQKDGQIQLWYNQSGLRVSEAELYELAQLLWQAAGRLNLLISDRLPTTNQRFGMYRRITSVPERPECRN